MKKNQVENKKSIGAREMEKFLNEIEKATKKLEELGYDKNQIVNIIIAFLNNAPIGMY